VETAPLVEAKAQCVRNMDNIRAAAWQLYTRYARYTFVSSDAILGLRGQHASNSLERRDVGTKLPVRAEIEPAKRCLRLKRHACIELQRLLCTLKRDCS
jgi:hypothetical protein